MLRRALALGYSTAVPGTTRPAGKVPGLGPDRPLTGRNVPYESNCAEIPLFTRRGHSCITQLRGIEVGFRLVIGAQSIFDTPRSFLLHYLDG